MIDAQCSGAFSCPRLANSGLSSAPYVTAHAPSPLLNLASQQLQKGDLVGLARLYYFIHERWSVGPCAAGGVSGA